MKNLVFLIFLALCAFVVVGWFLDWYTIAGLPGANGGAKVQIEINTNKIKDDLDKGIQKGRDALQKPDSSEPRPEPIVSMPREGGD